MIPLLERIFNSQNKKATKVFENVKEITTIQNELGRRKKDLDEVEYKNLIEDKNNIFISLGDFIDLMKVEDVSIEMLLKKCKHISELDTRSSVVEMYSIVEDNHIVLCQDIKKCEKHKTSSAGKLRIVTMRGVR